MSAPLSDKSERILRGAVDVGERIFILLLFAGFVARLSHSLAARPFNALVFVSEGLVVLFILIRRDAMAFTVRPLDWVVALVGTALSMFVKSGGHPLVPPVVGATLMITGLCFSIVAKLSLRRSIGIAPANRGVVRAGPYSIVRHPMYAGYIAVYVGFFLNNPLAWNLVVYVLTTACLVTRIAAEEAVLSKDPHYTALMDRTRYRLVPGLY